jgi:hypothetical protein
MSMLQNHDSALQPMTPALRLEQFGEQLLSEAVPMSQKSMSDRVRSFEITLAKVDLMAVLG